MALLELRNIGKIYVSDNSIAVGIRGVNLDFELGEFVAVTGKSGSGKTTLLNCISGMDSYEEGELYINGEQTSHFTQADWEEYRKKYISFIFQDYNIIDSFTVLQNVELALTHIESRAERRRRALELIDRVGMTSHKNSKGSKLSGGQKQRTVIARALAKDSPIILADEPTGNLDSKTGEEIVNLLAEIGKEKLVIVVTHSLSQFESAATREVRIFDGGVERDEKLKPADIIPYEEKPQPKSKTSDLRLGLELGRHKFFASPKLSVFMCFIMLVAMLGCFFITSVSFAGLDTGNMTELFSYSKGRLVISRQDGEVMSEDELEELTDKLGAESYRHYDHLYENISWSRVIEDDLFLYADMKFEILSSQTPDVGRLPDGADECLLYLPIEWQQHFGKDTLKNDKVTLFNRTYDMTVVGVDYYYDNTRPYAYVYVTEEGFERLSDISTLVGDSFNTVCSLSQEGEINKYSNAFNVRVDNTLADDEIYVIGNNYRDTVKYLKGSPRTITVEKNVYGSTLSKAIIFSADHKYEVVTKKCSAKYEGTQGEVYENCLFISPAVAKRIAEEFEYNDYTQASLFFKNDKMAEQAKAELDELGYAGIVSNERYREGEVALLSFLSNAMSIVIWGFSILFLSFFLALCSRRILAASNSDFAILRSMGISNKIVKISMYSRMLIACVPALVALAVVAPVIYLNPKFNPMFPFLQAHHYVLIVIGMVALSLLVTHRCNKKIFKNSVIKTLKGGERS